MPEYDNRNSFILFKNDDKQKETHADYRGTFTDENGKEYFADMWVKEGKKGKFLTGRIKPKTGGRQQPQGRPQQRNNEPDI